MHQKQTAPARGGVEAAMKSGAPAITGGDAAGIPSDATPSGLLQQQDSNLVKSSQ
jgi:hypothetical protein